MPKSPIVHSHTVTVEKTVSRNGQLSFPAVFLKFLRVGVNDTVIFARWLDGSIHVLKHNPGEDWPLEVGLVREGNYCALNRALQSDWGFTPGRRVRMRCADAAIVLQLLE